MKGKIIDFPFFSSQFFFLSLLLCSALLLLFGTVLLHSMKTGKVHIFSHALPVVHMPVDQWCLILMYLLRQVHIIRALLFIMCILCNRAFRYNATARLEIILSQLAISKTINRLVSILLAKRSHGVKRQRLNVAIPLYRIIHFFYFYVI